MTRPVETYEQAIDFLFGRINYERVQPEQYSIHSFRLDRMRDILTAIGNPQDRLPIVHIAGTKGKGSVAVMTAEILSAAGYRVGLFTSPHISSFEERMSVDGILPGPQQLIDLVNTLVEVVDVLERMPGGVKPTFFEMTTALAWLYFTQQQADVVVLEVGLGGRLDATNICRPEVTAITSISYDHTRILGESIAEIAREKAGIIKPGVPVISGATDLAAAEVIQSVCEKNNSPLSLLGKEIVATYDMADLLRKGLAASCADRCFGSTDIKTPFRNHLCLPVPLPGEHQANNTALAVGIVDYLNEQDFSVPADAVVNGLKKVTLPLRIEVIPGTPTVVVDAAHNVASIEALLKTLDLAEPNSRKVLVFAATRDKDVKGMLGRLAPKFDTIVLTQYASNPRALPLENVERVFRTISNRSVHLADESQAAWKLACHLSEPEDLICITGSFFIAAEMRTLILRERSDGSPEIRRAAHSLSMKVL